MDGLDSPDSHLDTACGDTASFSDTSIRDRPSFSAGEPAFHSASPFTSPNLKEFLQKVNHTRFTFCQSALAFAGFAKNNLHSGGIFDSSGYLSFDFRLNTPVLKVQLSHRRIALSSIMVILGRISTLC